VLGISFDAPDLNRAFAEKFAFPFRLLSDTSRAIALAYGAAESARDAYPRRMTFVIGPDGRLEQVIETADPGAQAEELLQSL
jgi:peroxiredoxin Q/BCP